MTRFRSLLLLVPALGLSACAGPGGPAAEPESAPRKLVSPYRVNDPSAEAITPATVYEHERFWPYRVGMAEVWQPAQMPNGFDRPLREKQQGVLIRVEPSGDPRVDFGSWGKYTVPLEKTDLVERANEIREGLRDKWGPNFVYAIQARMLDSTGDRATSVDLGLLDGRDAFLCVFVDFEDPAFEALAQALAPLATREDLLTILFPLGRHGDGTVFRRLQELDWKVPYVWDHLAEGYTRSLIGEPPLPPTVLLQSPEGRLLLQDTFDPESPDVLVEALAKSIEVVTAD